MPHVITIPDLLPALFSSYTLDEFTHNFDENNNKKA
jgi:hypothetical protein